MDSGDKVSAGKPPAAPERCSSTNAARDSANSFLTGVNLVDALVFANAEREANDLDSHDDLWRASEFSAATARPTAHAAGGAESSANAVSSAAAPTAANVPPVPVSLRPGTLIETPGA